MSKAPEVREERSMGPVSFSAIWGQEQAIQKLQVAFRRGRIPNAYLFVGMEGIGKSATAHVLASLLNCEGPRQGVEPCGVCASCRKISHNNHTDVWTIAAEGNTIKIDQIRWMQRVVRFPPKEAMCRVVIVDGVEKMNRESSNAFLKVLEEPPPQNLFVLITPHASQLLPTLISRCQRVSFAPLPRASLQQLLVEHHGLDPMQATLAAGISEGSVGKALQLQEHVMGSDRRDFLQRLPRLLEQPSGMQVALELAQNLTKSTIPVSLFLDLLRMWYRDLLMLREMRAPSSHLINQDLTGALHEHLHPLTTSMIFEAIRAVEEAEKALKRNAAPLLTLERLFLTLGGVG